MPTAGSQSLAQPRVRRTPPATAPVSGPRTMTAPRYHRAIAPCSPPEDAPPTATRGKINIGLDFGTSTTKACVRPALGLDPNVRTYPIAWAGCGNAYLCPSLVSARDGRLYFGPEASVSPRHHTFRHLKVCLACQAEAKVGEDAIACTQRQGRLGTARPCNQRFLIDDARVSAEDLCTLYLAWAVGEVTRSMPAGLMSGGTLPAINCSFGVPVDQLDARSPLRSVFERVVRNAWRLKACVTQGVPLESAVGWVRALGTQRAPRTPSADAAVVTCPETLAAALSYVTAPNVKRGMYALMDVGAWTTDISVFRLSDVSMSAEGRRTTAVYDARTFRVAASLIDQLTSDLHLQLWAACGDECSDYMERVLDETRMRRESGELSGAPYTINGRELPAVPPALAYARAVVGRIAARNFVSTYDRASRKETALSRHDWSSLDVFLLGGGSEDPVFAEHLHCVNGATSIRSVRLLPGTSNVAWPGAPGDDKLHRRLQVAAGLAIPYALWPREFRPSEVEVPLPAARPPVQEWDRDPYD